MTESRVYQSDDATDFSPPESRVHGEFELIDGTRWQGHTRVDGQFELLDYEELRLPPHEWPEGTKIVIYVPWDAVAPEED